MNNPHVFMDHRVLFRILGKTSVADEILTAFMYINEILITVQKTTYISIKRLKQSPVF